jgi:hypothetical protein
MQGWLLMPAQAWRHICILLAIVGGRSARLVNPLAWEKGAVFAQCQHCDVWHTLAAAPHIIEEIRYNDPTQQQQQQQQQNTPLEAATAAGELSCQSQIFMLVLACFQPLFHML